MAGGVGVDQPAHDAGPGAFWVAVMDLVGVFIPELAAGMQNADTQGGLRVFHHYGVAAVAYDSAGRVVGVFPGAGEYSVLPEDGRPRVVSGSLAR